MQAFVSQRLIPTIEGKRVAAIEIMLGSPMIKDLILKGELGSIKEIMEKSEEQGMQTFDSHLYKLYLDKKISLVEALRNADSPSNLKLRINLSAGARNNNPAPEPEKTTEETTTDTSQTQASTPDLSSLSIEPKAEEVEED